MVLPLVFTHLLPLSRRDGLDSCFVLCGLSLYLSICSHLSRFLSSIREQRERYMTFNPFRMQPNRYQFKISFFCTVYTWHMHLVVSNDPYSIFCASDFLPLFTCVCTGTLFIHSYHSFELEQILVAPIFLPFHHHFLFASS